MVNFVQSHYVSNYEFKPQLEIIIIIIGFRTVTVAVTFDFLFMVMFHSELLIVVVITFDPLIEILTVVFKTM